MTRALGLFGFTGGFLFLSPQLRQTLMDLAVSSLAFVHDHSPYSYLGIVVVAFGVVTVTLVSGSSPR
jgi:hypothetical protein